MFYKGELLLLSRWSFETLALTHLLTLGFMSMVMVGALLQLLPVLAGVQIPKSLWTSTFLHGLLTLGTISLSSGFMIMNTDLLNISFILLILTFLLFFSVIGYCLIKSVKTAITTAMRFAIISLFFSVIVGLSLLTLFTHQNALPMPHILTNLHLTWGLIGWASLLVIGVAYQIVPMFQITPAYPIVITRWLVLSVFSILSLWTITYIIVNFFDFNKIVAKIFAGLMALGLGLFATTTLYLQKKRLRKLPDVSLNYWRVGMIALLATIFIWIIAQIWNELARQTFYPLLIGILFIGGFILPIIQGTLYKIVPFIIWLHLQNRQMNALESNSTNIVSIPTMKQIISIRQMRYQFYIYLLGLFCLVISLYWHKLIYGTALILTVAFLLLTYSLFKALWIYTTVCRQF